jgi:hypothetical protein
MAPLCSNLSNSLQFSPNSLATTPEPPFRDSAPAAARLETCSPLELAPARLHVPSTQPAMSKVSQGCMGMFSKAAPSADVTKLKPGIALPHVTLPTTEVRLQRASIARSPGRGARAQAAAGVGGNCRRPLDSTFRTLRLQGGRVEVGAPTGRWQLVVVYRGKHDPVCVTYLAALQVSVRPSECAVPPPFTADP